MCVRGNRWYVLLWWLLPLLHITYALHCHYKKLELKLEHLCVCVCVMCSRWDVSLRHIYTPTTYLWLIASTSIALRFQRNAAHISNFPHFYCHNFCSQIKEVVSLSLFSLHLLLCLTGNIHTWFLPYKLHFSSLIFLSSCYTLFSPISRNTH